MLGEKFCVYEYSEESSVKRKEGAVVLAAGGKEERG